MSKPALKSLHLFCGIGGAERWFGAQPEEAHP